jgi:cell migration-inducing and hyaluronan-binding protein
VSTNNSIEKVTFENAKPVYFPPTERRWQFTGEFGSFSGWNGAVIHDKDGSASGIPNSYIVMDNGIAFDDRRCELKPSWGAAVCTGDMGRMGISANLPGGGRGGGAAAGAGATKAAPVPAAGAGAAKGGPAGPGATKGVQGGFGGRGAVNPVVLVRGGRRVNLTGPITVLAGTEMRAESEAPALNVQLTEMDPGSWVIVEFPGYTSAASATAVSSLEALRSATSNAYYKDAGALWVKVVSNGGGAIAGAAGRGGVPPSSVQVSR